MKLHITHTDLDGVGAAVLSKLYDDSFRHVFVSYNTINEVVQQLPLANLDALIISDIMVTTPEAIEKLNSPGFKDNCFKVICDHHATAKDNLDKLSSNFIIKYDDKKCGCSLLYEVLADYLPARAKDFSLLVEDYDLFIRQYPESDDFSWLITAFYGIKDDKIYYRMVDNFIYWINNGDFLTGTKSLIAEVKERYSHDLDSARKTITDIELDDIKFRLCKANRSVSKIGWDLGQEDNIVVLLDDYSNIHFRSRKIDVTPYAKLFGGGGHKGASGAAIHPIHKLLVWFQTQK